MYYDFDYVSILKVLSIKKDWFTIRNDRKPAFIFYNHDYDDRGCLFVILNSTTWSRHLTGKDFDFCKNSVKKTLYLEK